MNLKVREQIKVLLVQRKMKLKGLAQKLTEKTGKKYTENSLSQRLGRGSITYNEMLFIAEILDFKIEIVDKNN